MSEVSSPFLLNRSKAIITDMSRLQDAFDPVKGGLKLIVTAKEGKREGSIFVNIKVSHMEEGKAKLYDFAPVLPTCVLFKKVEDSKNKGKITFDTSELCAEDYDELAAWNDALYALLEKPVTEEIQRTLAASKDETLKGARIAFVGCHKRENIMMKLDGGSKDVEQWQLTRLNTLERGNNVAKIPSMWAAVTADKKQINLGPSFDVSMTPYDPVKKVPTKRVRDKVIEEAAKRQKSDSDQTAESEEA